MSHESLKTSVQEQFNQCAQFYLKGSLMDDQELLNQIVQLIKPKPDDQALDMACGAGFLVCKLANSVRRAVGIDLSTVMLRVAENYALALKLANASFQLGDGETLPYADETFDIVSCKLALHYFPNPERVISEMKRIAKSEARLVLIDRISSENLRKQEYHNRIEKLRTPSKIKVYSPSEIVRLLEEQNLSVEQVHHYEQHQDFAEWIKTTGAPAENLERARELILQSIEEDLTGLNVRMKDGQLIMTHNTAIYIAKKSCKELLNNE